MGKTESGTLWLSADKTSEVSFYQYWVNTADGDVGHCLRFLTDLCLEEIDSVLAEHQVDPGKRIAQRRLADEVTRLVHGEEGLERARRATHTIFVEIRETLSFSESVTTSVVRKPKLTDSQLTDAFANAPCTQLPRDRLSGDGLWIIDALAESGLCKTKNEARRVVSQGGAYVNEHRVEGIEMKLTPTDLASESTIILRSGKKNYALLRFV
jgi:tyrosyl-tRNA synthetase